MIKSLILISSVFFFSFAQLTTIDTTTMKKIEKKVKKLSGSKDIKLEEFQPQTTSHDEIAEQVTSYKIIIEDLDWGYAHVAQAEACHFGGCVDPNLLDDTSKLSRDRIKYFVISNLAGNIIDIQILDFESSYGYEITSRSWLKQFIGKHPGEFSLGKNIDVISGATISCNSMVESLNSLMPAQLEGSN